jgi:hypothetical protein
MSFKHMSVAFVEKRHAQQVQFQQTHVETLDVTRADTRARCTREVDGVMVTTELANLCDRVRAMHRHIKFAMANRPATLWVDGFSIPTELWAYFPGDQYCVMRLSYADFAVNGTANKYAVYSRHIHNEKYRSDRDQHHMVMSDTLERAVKNVNKYMRPYSPTDIARMSFSDFEHSLQTQTWKLSSAYNEASNAVTNHKSLFSEMRGLINLGYQFNDASFTAAVKTMIATHEENEAKRHMAHHGYYVQVRECMGEQVFDVIPVFDIKKTPISNLGTHQTYNAEKLAQFDEDLPNKLAALSMLDDGAFVEGLGLKANESRYWVLK